MIDIKKRELQLEFKTGKLGASNKNLIPSLKSMGYLSMGYKGCKKEIIVILPRGHPMGWNKYIESDVTLIITVKFLDKEIELYLSYLDLNQDASKKLASFFRALVSKYIKNVNKKDIDIKSERKMSNNYNHSVDLPFEYFEMDNMAEVCKGLEKDFLTFTNNIKRQKPRGTIKV